jgi:hypothetical protein
MITVNQIRSMLQSVVLDRISLDEFDEWFAGASWNMQKGSSELAQKMAGQIELGLSEFDIGQLSENDLRGKLLSLIPYFFVGLEPQMQLSTGASLGSVQTPVWTVVFDNLSVEAPSYTPLLQAI